MRELCNQPGIRCECAFLALFARRPTRCSPRPTADSRATRAATRAARLSLSPHTISRMSRTSSKLLSRRYARTPRARRGSLLLGLRRRRSGPEKLQKMTPAKRNRKPESQALPGSLIRNHRVFRMRTLQAPNPHARYASSAHFICGAISHP